MCIFGVMRKKYENKRKYAWGRFLWLFLAAIATGGYAQDAVSILDKAAAAYESSNGLRAHFIMQTRSDEQKMSESFEGTLDLKGDKFVLKTPGMTTWFDGTTQWSYVDRNEEVNVTTPTGEELQMTNPAFLLRLYEKGFTPSYKGESTAPSGKAAYEVELTPKKKTAILKVRLQIEKASGLPGSITILDKNGLSNTIRIGKIETGVNQPDSYFVFNETEYPDAEIIDLR